MKRYAIFMVLMLLAAWVALAEMMAPGLHGVLTGGGILKGAVVMSTNATQTATVDAVYEWPIYGSITNQTVSTVRYQETYAKVETLTNFCDYVTETSVTNITGSVTNVVYFDGIVTVTNNVLRPVTRYVTNTLVTTEIVGVKAVTNSLYSLTASGGYGASSDTKLIGAGGRLLIKNWPVTLFWE